MSEEKKKDERKPLWEELSEVWSKIRKDQDKLWDYYHKEAARKSIQSVKSPNDQEAREKALKAIYMSEGIEQALKDIAPYLGRTY